MKRIYIIAAALLFCLIPTSALGQRLVILHTNDSHSQIEPLRIGNDRGKGGVDRRLQFIDSVRNVYGKNRVLLVDAGDYNQGTPYFTVCKGDLEVELHNALGYEVETLGNHEFDNGQQELARRLAMGNFKTLCCNYDFSESPLKDYVEPYTIIKRGGFKIGIIGATADLSSLVATKNIQNLPLLNTLEEINRHAEYLKKKKKCDIVILLSHLGHNGGTLEKPSDVVVGKNSRDIDYIIGGHSHTVLHKPTYVKNLDDKDIMIVQAGSRGVYVGELKIY